MVKTPCHRVSCSPMKPSNLTAANYRERITLEKLNAYSDAAIAACREAGVGSTFDLADSFSPAFEAYQRVFESPSLCPASAAHAAAMEAARRGVYGGRSVYPAPL